MKSSLTTIATWTASSLVLLGCLHAADEQDARTRQYQLSIVNQMNKLLEQDQQVRLKYLNDSIADMRQVCELSDNQARKLAVAAKGAVHYALEQHRETMAQFVSLDLRAIQVAYSQYAIQRGAIASVAEQPIWTRTVERILTDEQLGAYRTVSKQRVAAKKRSLTEQCLKMLAALVPMSVAQREKIVVLVENHLDQQLGRLSDQQIMALTDREGFGVLATLPSAQVKTILDPSQQVRWDVFVRSTTQPRLRRGGIRAVDVDINLRMLQPAGQRLIRLQQALPNLKQAVPIQPAPLPAGR